jgi:hypothetical protein
MARSEFDAFPYVATNTDTGIDSSFWQVHLNAARTVMASSEDTISVESADDSTLVFLEQE